jgi:hypothetical protein
MRFRIRAGVLPTPLVRREPAALIFVVMALSLSCTSLCLAQSKAQVTVLKVRIEAPELDKRMLLDRMESHAADRGLKFESVDQDFDYRIVFATGQHAVTLLGWGSGGSVNASLAAADVYDAKGKELFKFDRKGRGSDKGATNAVAKEIIKRLLEWRALSESKR